MATTDVTSSLVAQKQQYYEMLKEKINSEQESLLFKKKIQLF